MAKRKTSCGNARMYRKEDTNEHLFFETKKRRCKRLRRKKVLLLLNSCDESQIRISTVSKNKKGEPLIAVACAGCGRTQLLRPRRVVLCDGYTCGFGGHCAKNPRFVLPAVPDRCVRHIVPNAAGCFQWIQHSLRKPRRNRGNRKSQRCPHKATNKKQIEDKERSELE